MRYILHFMGYPLSMKLLCVRVFFLAVYYKLLIRLRPFSGIAGRLGKMGEISSDHPLPPGEREKILMVRRSVRAVVPKMHFKNECLVSAFTAKRILKGTPATIYMGVAKKKDGGMRAHAWMRTGDIIVTGEEGRERFTVTATFA